MYTKYTTVLPTLAWLFGQFFLLGKIVLENSAAHPNFCNLFWRCLVTRRTKFAIMWMQQHNQFYSLVWISFQKFGPSLVPFLPFFMKIRPKFGRRLDEGMVHHWLINYVDTKAKCRHLKKIFCKGTLRQGWLKRKQICIAVPFRAQMLPFVERPDPRGLSTFSQCTEFLLGIRTHILQIWS